MTEATELRAEGKAKNAAIVADATGAQAAVEAAIKVLKDVYDNPTGAALLQSMNQAASLAQEMKATSKEPYTGMSSGSGGIDGLLHGVCGIGKLIAPKTTEIQGCFVIVFLFFLFLFCNIFLQNYPFSLKK